MKAIKHAITVLAMLLLAACGGSSSDFRAEPAETQQQREDRVASSSIDGLMAFMRGIVGGTAEQAEPRPVGSITPPASETAEPQPL